jgi:hypothetical protein
MKTRLLIIIAIAIFLTFLIIVGGVFSPQPNQDLESKFLEKTLILLFLKN